MSALIISTLRDKRLEVADAIERLERQVDDVLRDAAGPMTTRDRRRHNGGKEIAGRRRTHTRIDSQNSARPVEPGDRYDRTRRAAGSVARRVTRRLPPAANNRKNRLMAQGPSLIR